MGTTRLEAFSDGVIAIILTIMVLELKVPHQPTPDALLALWPVYLAYAIAFANILADWIAHHHLFARVEIISPRILLFNGLLLFFMSLVPFALSYGSEFHWSESLPSAFYGGVMVLVCLGFAWLRAAVARVAPNVAAQEHVQVRASLWMAGFYLVGAGTAWQFPLAALLIYALIPVVRVLTAPQFRAAMTH